MRTAGLCSRGLLSIASFSRDGAAAGPRGLYGIQVLAGAVNPNSRFERPVFARPPRGNAPRQAVAYAADLPPQFVTASVYEESLFLHRLEREPAQVEAYFRAAPADRFEFGLDILVAGLSALAARSR